MKNNLFTYKFVSQAWHETESLTDQDVCVIIDTDNSMIWYYEGTNAKSKSKNEARNFLGDLQIKYKTYNFKHVSTETPNYIIQELYLLKQKNFLLRLTKLPRKLKHYSSVYYFANLIASLFLIVSFSISLLTTYTSRLIFINGNLHFSLIYSHFIFINTLIFSCSLASFISFFISLLFGIFFKQKSVIFYELLGCITAFINLFIITIWDMLMFYNLQGIFINFRYDVYSLFNLNLGIVSSVGILIGVIMSLKGLERFRSLVNLTGSNQ
jgi:hypothetical protein